MTESNYIKYRGKCKKMAEQSAAEDLTLTVVRGHYYCPIWNRREPHWWCVKPDGEIVDPSALQFPSGGLGIGNYEPFYGYLACEECGKTIHENEISSMSSGSHPVCSYECYGRLIGLIK